MMLLRLPYCSPLQELDTSWARVIVARDSPSDAYSCQLWGDDPLNKAIRHSELMLRVVQT